MRRFRVDVDVGIKMTDLLLITDDIISKALFKQY